MGKHERDWVEEAEKAVTSGLNGQPQNIWIDQVVNGIKLKVQPSYTQAVWAGGNNYANPGDVHVHYADNSVIKIELKFSRGQGQGTAKNPGQQYFSETVDASIKGYSQFDREMGLKDQRWQLVEQMSGTKLQTDSQYETMLYQYRITQPAVLTQIAKITAPGQTGYAQYAAEQLNQHLPKVNLMIQKLLNTNLVDQTRQDVLYCVVKQFETEKQTVKFYDFAEMDKGIVNVLAKGKSIKFQNQSGKDVVRFSVTWKNICQGGSTPCFNVFVGNAFKGK